MSDEYDVIVVGSGAAGSWAAKELAERGARTLVLEAGPPVDRDADFPETSTESGSKVAIAERIGAVLRGQGVQARCMSFGPLTRDLFVNDRENPYTTPSGERFNWYRSRRVGGRLHLWGRNALRISDRDLHPSAHDGFGEDWPISYADLEPWYERVETFMGVHGEAAGIPVLPDGVYESPHALTGEERRILAEMGEKWPERPATTCRIIRHNRDRVPPQITRALDTGNLEVRSDAVVKRLDVDDDTGCARGVVYVDRASRREVTVAARAVVLGASTIESIRILLNSGSSKHPRGVGNSSGNLGRYITDHTMVFRAGPLDQIEGVPGRDPYDFGAQSGLYVPRFQNLAGDDGKGYLRGFSMLGSVSRIEPGWFFMAIGEMLPRAENTVTLDPRKKDAWGIPAPRIRCRHSDNERAMIADMQATLVQLARDFGLRDDMLGKEGFLSRLIYRFAGRLVYTADGALVPGSAIHEAGGAGMGDDPARHVLDRHNRCFDAPNVFVTDSASFSTSPFHNPGLTIMALSARAANFIADEMQSGRL